MSFLKIRTLALLLLGGSFFILDRFLKYLAFTHQETVLYVWRPWIGWEYFANPGIAFGIPLPWFTSLIYTPIILFLVFWYAKKRMTKNLISTFGLILILYGALSNLLDRLFYHITIDYIRIVTSLINLADVMIVCGAIFLFWQELKKKA